MTEQILKQEVLIDGQQVLSIATPDIVSNHVAQVVPKSERAAEVDPVKMQVMQNAVAKIEKAFGTCAIMRMNDEVVQDVDVIPTGSIGLDKALGVRAATLSMTMTSIAAERISWSAISRACSPLSGWLIHKLRVFTPTASA